MGGSDAHALLAALSSVVEGLDRCLTSPRTLVRPNIGTLHLMPMPGAARSLWGVVKRYPDQPEPFYAVFEVEGADEPSIVQEAHYTATRRLDAHYLAAGAPILTALACAQGAPAATATRAEEHFRTLSMRIPPNPFNGEPWKLRYRHRLLPHLVFELEYAAADLKEACVFSDVVGDLAGGNRRFA